MISIYANIIKKLNLNPKTVLEIGSRDGNDAKYLSEQFNIQDSEVYLVEPNPLMVKTISENYPKYKLYDVAISNEEGLLKFNQVVSSNLDHVGVSSLLGRNDGFYQTYNTVVIDVNSITGENLLNQIDKVIDICKIDVEGLSYEVLESFSDKINLINTIHIETERYEIWKGQKTHDDVANLLKEKGYECVYQELVCADLQYDTIWIKKELLKK